MDKTVEELKAELEMIKKRNLEDQLRVEKDKEAKRLEEIRLQEKTKEREQYEAEFKAKYGIGAVSKAPEGRQASNLSGKDNSWETFKADYIAKQQAAGRKDIKGRSYLEVLRDRQMERAI